jgi:hypothetical protein
MVNSGGSFWGFKEGASARICAAHIHDLPRDQSANPRGPYATVPTEGGDRIGHQARNRDYCNALARAVLQRVEDRGIPASWH